MIEFDVNIISKLVLTIISYIFLLHIHLEGEYQSFFTCNLFHKLSTQLITVKKRPTN